MRQKLIQRYTIEVNDKELGYTVKSVTGINMDSKKRDQIIDALFEIEGVREISEVTGRFDIMVTMYAKSLSEMHNIFLELKAIQQLKFSHYNHHRYLLLG